MAQFDRYKFSPSSCSKLLYRVGKINFAAHNSIIEDYCYANLAENSFPFRSDESVLHGTQDTIAKHLLIALKSTLFLDKLINACGYCRQNLKINLKQPILFQKWDQF